MALSDIAIEMGIKPSITVKNQNEENYQDALLKAKQAMQERMHGMIDLYCEQLRLLDRFSEKAMSQKLPPEKFWSELMNYAIINFEERQQIFNKVKGSSGLDCYTMLMNYDAMGLPWPDGYKEPAQRIQGLAPIGLGRNWFFFAEGNIVYELDFGSCNSQQKRLKTTGENFNKRLETVALQNYEFLRQIPHGNYMQTCFEKLICAKHGNHPEDVFSIKEIFDSFTLLAGSMTMFSGYSLKLMDEIDDTRTNFPQRFAICYEDKIITLEDFFDRGHSTKG